MTEGGTNDHFFNMQDFCYQNLWPPLKALITVQGEAGKSCKEVCLSKGMSVTKLLGHLITSLTQAKRVAMIRRSLLSTCFA